MTDQTPDQEVPATVAAPRVRRQPPPFDASIAHDFDRLASLVKNLLIENKNFQNGHYYDTEKSTIGFVRNVLKGQAEAILERIHDLKTSTLDVTGELLKALDPNKIAHANQYVSEDRQLEILQEIQRRPEGLDGLIHLRHLIREAVAGVANGKPTEGVLPDAHKVESENASLEKSNEVLIETSVKRPGPMPRF